jgi:hypothetical protein
MNSLFYYIIQVIICSGILYGYYHLALRNKKFHLYNRYYLLGAVFISITIPFLNIPVYFIASSEKPSVILQTLAIISPHRGGGQASNHFAPASPTSIFTLKNITTAFYFIVASFVFIRFLTAIIYIKKLIHKYIVERINHIYLINTDEPGTPFSFFKWLFWNKKIEVGSEEGQQIFRHELFHIEQKHSWDIIFIEITSIIFWINPFFYLIKKEIKTIHEFLADEFSTKEKDKLNYAELLLMQVLDSPYNNLANPFFHNQIKRRITMITSSNKPKYQFVRKLMILPVIIFVFVLFAFKLKSNSEKTIKKSEEGITVVTNGMRTGRVQTFFQERDTSKPTIKKKEKQQQLEKTPRETEKAQQEFEQLIAEKQREAEKLQQEFKELMEAKQREVEKAQQEFKQLMAEKQKEAEKTQEEFKEMMEAQRREADKKQEEFKKMTEQHQVDPKEQEKFKLLMAEKQKEAEKTQEEFKLLMMRKQKEAEKSQEEFKQLMMLKQQEAEKTQKEFKEMMEAKQREAEKEQEEFKKKVLLKQQESEKNKKETEKIHNEKNKE